jgi:hypothetical protein
VLRRSLFVFTFVLIGTAVLNASSLMCTQASGTSNVFTDSSCSPLFAASATLDWGSPVQGSILGMMGSNSGGLGDSSLASLGGEWPVEPDTILNAGVSGIGVQVSSNDALTRAQNTEWAWNGTNWTPSSFVNGTQQYFFGHFGAPSTPADPQFGDNLLGALSYDGSVNGSPQITLSFSEELGYVAFQISSAIVPSFAAQLVAFDSSNNQIGTYRIVSGGGGGACAGLAQNPPQPCNDAPLIQFYDPNFQIASVELIMLTDTTGVFIDSLEVTAAPEPYSFLYAVAGLALMFGVAKRKQLRRVIRKHA